MKFSRSTLLLLCLSLKTLTSIIRTDLPILVELIDLVNSVITSNDLTQMVNFPTHSPAPLDWFLSSDASICSTMAFPPLGNSDHVAEFWSFWVSNKLKTGCLISSHSLWLLSVLIGMVFVFIWEMLHGRVSLNSVALLLPANFVSVFRLELIYIYPAS